MNDARGLHRLERLVHDEARSLLQYMERAFPWTTAVRTPALERLETMLRAERDALTGLVRFLLRHHLAPPFAGAYPTDFTSLNFVTLDHALGLLIQAQQDAIARWTDTVPLIADEEARRLAEQFLALKRTHLQELKLLANRAPAVTS